MATIGMNKLKIFFTLLKTLQNNGFGQYTHALTEYGNICGI